MDQRSFDRLTRVLGEATDRRAGLRAALGALLGAGGAAAMLQADAEAKKRRGKDAGPEAGRKKRKKTCKPACGSGFDCVKVGKQRECRCATGVTCGEACCRVGQVCEGGACVAQPEPGACLAFGEACKDVGKRCCDGLSCASGQDGSYPVACYRSKGAACERTAECPFGMSCTGGVCLGNGGGDGDDGGGGGGGGSSTPTGQPCAAGSTCAQPGATCTAYTGSGAPSDTYCTLPLRRACAGDIDCTCYHCWYVNGGAEATTRASTNTKACCHPTGTTCATDSDCCSGLSCGSNNQCTGDMCVPIGGTCDPTYPCCDGLPCSGGICAGTSRTCTIKRSDYQTDAAAGAALKALVESATGDSTITVGPGTYKPVPGEGQPAALVVGRNLTIEACDPDNRPFVDGGATVTGATDVNAENLTWSGGSRIMDVPAGTTVTVDGIRFRNGNAATSTVDDSKRYDGGAIRSFGKLTLKNLDISRCSAGGSDRGGGLAAYGDSADGEVLVLNDVDFFQNAANDGGAGIADGVLLTMTGSAARKAKIHYNFASGYTGGFYSFLMPNSVKTVTLQYLDVRHNRVGSDGSFAGGIYIDSAALEFGGEKYVSAIISDVDIEDNSAPNVGGLFLNCGDGSTSGTGKPRATITAVNIKHNTAYQANDGYAGGLFNQGRLTFGTGVVISGNKAAIGSGVNNQAITANVTCTYKVVTDDTNNNATAYTPAADNQTYADCFSSDSTVSATSQIEGSKMPAGCCNTVSCTNVVCATVCCASGQTCVDGVCTGP